MLTVLSRSIRVTGIIAVCLFTLGCGGSTSDDGGSGTGGGGSGGTGGAGGGCDYLGKHYPPGSFPAGDGCNTCQCSPDGTVGCTLMYCVPGCEYNGQSYQPGQTYPAVDGCNTCSCQTDGQSVCTKKACAVTCTYAGQEYQMGDEFPALDGCNTCTCTDQGVSCTEALCICDPTKEWWRDYLYEDANECLLLYTCPENTVAFNNACGCGCEQDASCPPYIDCMPPAPDCDEMKKKCPYSGVAL